MRWPLASILRRVLLLCACLAPLPGLAREPFAPFLARLGLPDEAAAELERADLLDPQGGFEASGGPALGLRLLAEGHGAAAARILRRAVDRTGDVGSLRLSLALSLLKDGAYPQAVQEFARVEAFADAPRLRLLAARFRCMAHLHAVDVRPATACAREVLGPSWENAATELAAPHLDPGRRAWIGGTLSALVPGLGQLTAGEPGEAAGAALVNSAWGYGFVELLLADAAVDATLLGLGVGLRYYVGNVQHGAAAWRARAERSRRDRARQLLQAVADVPLPAADPPQVAPR